MRIIKISDTRYCYNDKYNAFIRQSRYSSRCKSSLRISTIYKRQQIDTIVAYIEGPCITMSMGDGMATFAYLQKYSLGCIRRWHHNAIAEKNRIGYYTFNRKDIYQPISQYKDIFI